MAFISGIKAVKMRTLNILADFNATLGLDSKDCGLTIARLYSNQRKAWP